jgi:hypothetical protein
LLDACRQARRFGHSAPSSPVMTNTSMSPLLLMISSTSDWRMRLRQPLRLGLPTDDLADVAAPREREQRPRRRSRH